MACWSFVEVSYPHRHWRGLPRRVHHRVKARPLDRCRPGVPSGSQTPKNRDWRIDLVAVQFDSSRKLQRIHIVEKRHRGLIPAPPRRGARPCARTPACTTHDSLHATIFAVTPFVDAHVSSLIEDLRLLESLVHRAPGTACRHPDAPPVGAAARSGRPGPRGKTRSDASPTVSWPKTQPPSPSKRLTTPAPPLGSWRPPAPSMRGGAFQPSGWTELGGVLLRAHERVAGDLRAKDGGAGPGDST